MKRGVRGGGRLDCIKTVLFFFFWLLVRSRRKTHSLHVAIGSHSVVVSIYALGVAIISGYSIFFRYSIRRYSVINHNHHKVDARVRCLASHPSAGGGNCGTPGI